MLDIISSSLSILLGTPLYIWVSHHYTSNKRIFLFPFPLSLHCPFGAAISHHRGCATSEPSNQCMDWHRLISLRLLPVHCQVMFSKASMSWIHIQVWCNPPSAVSSRLLDNPRIDCSIMLCLWQWMQNNCHMKQLHPNAIVRCPMIRFSDQAVLAM